MLKLTKRKGSPFWQIHGTCPYTGERLRISTGTDREGEAKNILAATLSRRHREAVYGPATETLVAEAVLEYIDKGGDARFLGPILEHLGKSRMMDVKDQDLSALGRKVYPEAKPSTLVRQLYGPFQAVWNAAAKAEMVPARTIAKPKVKRVPAKYPKDDWLWVVLKSLTRLEQRAALLFMSFSGARASEVVAVKVKNHDPAKGTVLLENTKNGEPRLVPLPALVNDALKLLPHNKPEDPLFGYTQRFALNNMLKRACKRAGVEYMSPHKAGRHAFSARFLNDGNSLKALQEAGGWKSLTVVANIYGHLERAQTDQAMRSVRTDLDTQETHTAIQAPNDWSKYVPKTKTKA